MSHVVSEALLVVLGLVGAWGARRAPSPARLYWLLGIGTIVLAAAVGALEYAGLRVEGVHAVLVDLSMVVGIAGLLAGALSTFWVTVPSLPFAGLIFAGLAAVRFGLGTAWQGLAMLGIALAGLAARSRNPRGAALAFAGVLVLAVGQPLSGFLPEAGAFEPMDGFHLALGVALLCLGLAAGSATSAPEAEPASR